MSRGLKITVILILFAALIGGKIYLDSMPSHQNEVHKDLYYCPMIRIIPAIIRGLARSVL